MVRHGLILGLVGTFVCITAALLPHEPVCGTDGKSYVHSDVLNSQKAEDPDLEVAHQGACHSKHDNTEEPPVAACSTEVKEVCGSDEVTYINACTLNQASNSENNITLKHFGSCANNTDAEFMNETSDIKNDTSEVLGNSTIAADATENLIEISNEAKEGKISELEDGVESVVANSEGDDQVQNLEMPKEDSTNATKKDCFNNSSTDMDGETDDLVNNQTVSETLNNIVKNHQNTSDSEDSEIKIENDEAKVQNYNEETSYPIKDSENDGDSLKNSQDSEQNKTNTGNEDDLKFGKNKSEKSRKRRSVTEPADVKNNLEQNPPDVKLTEKSKGGKNKSGKFQTQVGNIEEEVQETLSKESHHSRKRRDIKATQKNNHIHTGPASNFCPCTKELREVCGTNGVTYANPCLLKCAAKDNKKIQLKFEGPCDGKGIRGKIRKTRGTKSCLCNKELKPVCSENGITYNNKCEMKCAGEKKGHKGACAA